MDFLEVYRKRNRKWTPFFWLFDAQPFFAHRPECKRDEKRPNEVDGSVKVSLLFLLYLLLDVVVSKDEQKNSPPPPLVRLLPAGDSKR